MWQGDFTFEALMHNWLEAVDQLGGTLEAEATFRGQLNIVSMKGRQTIFAVCCTRCMLYSVFDALGVCCTRCMLHSLYAALIVNSWWWHGEKERDHLTFCSCDDGRVVDERDWDRVWRWRWEQYGNYERLWEIRSTTCLIALRKPRVSVITCRIWTRTCCIGDGQLTRTRNCVKSQFLMMISPISSDLSNSCAQLYHHAKHSISNGSS